MAKKQANAGNKKPANPSKDEIRPRVIAVIDAEAALNHASAGKRADLRAGANSSLEDDLNINAARRDMLSINYSNISEDYVGGRVVTPTMARNAETAHDAVDKVHERAQTKKK